MKSDVTDTFNYESMYKRIASMHIETIFLKGQKIIVRTVILSHSLSFLPQSEILSWSSVL